MISDDLWGHTDSIRLMSKGLRRAIFVICGTTDPNVVHHIMFQPQRILDQKTKKTIPSTALHQLSYQEWLTEIQKEVTANVTPLVLSHTTNHYNAVLLHHDEALTQRKIPNKVQKLTDLWGPALLPAPAPGQTGSKAHDPAATENGPTRLQLIEYQSSIHKPEVFRALSQENWTLQEKKTAIDALVRGTGRLKELLVFTADENMSDEEPSDKGDDDHATQHASQASDRTFVPSTGNSRSAVVALTQESITPPSADGLTAPSENVYALPTAPTDVIFSDWVQDHWERIVADWAGQGGIHPPGLDDRAVITKFAAEYPEVMAELAQQHPNPFTVLDHLEDAGARGWFMKKRIRYCVDEIEQVVTTVENAAARQMLTDWIKDVSSTVPLTEQVVKYRNSDMWKMLRTQAAAQMQHRRMLTMSFMQDCLCVMAVDELFPGIATSWSTKEKSHKNKPISATCLSLNAPSRLQSPEQTSPNPGSHWWSMSGTSVRISANPNEREEVQLGAEGNQEATNQ